MRPRRSLGLTLVVLFAVIPAQDKNNEIKARVSRSCDAKVTIDRRYQKTITPAYQKAMRDYNKRHYHLDKVRLTKPKIIILHATFVSTLKESLRYFKDNVLSPMRQDLRRGGRVNIGVHFIVDRNGKVYSLTPIDYTSRHAVGLNHTAIGIENVARNNGKLTRAQVESNIRLVTYLKNKRPSIKYLIGHDEYNDKSLPHYKYVITKDSNYSQWDKPDPGEKFMERVRFGLRQCDIVFLR